MVTLRESSALRTPFARHAILWLLLLLAGLSATVGAVNGMNRSQDFQWSGERVLLQHVDPWMEYLQGDPAHRFILSQVPNYLPVLYVLLVPVGLLSLSYAKGLWVFCNLTFAVTSGFAAARFYQFRGRSVVAIVCLLLIATPTRNSMGNGQQALLILMIWCLTLLTPRLTDRRACLAGISYFKFTFAPPLFLYLLFRGGLRAVVLAAIPVLAGLLLVWFWLTQGHDFHELLRLTWEPLRVAQHGYTPDRQDPNLMNLVEVFVNGRMREGALNGLELALALVVCVPISYLAFRRHRDSSVQWQMAIMATMSYTLFKHHAYDEVVLLLPLCYALRFWRDAKAQFTLLLLGYLLYVQRIVDAIHLHLDFAAIQFAMLVCVLALMYRMRGLEETAEPAWADFSKGV